MARPPASIEDMGVSGLKGLLVTNVGANKGKPSNQGRHWLKGFDTVQILVVT